MNEANKRQSSSGYEVENLRRSVTDLTRRNADLTNMNADLNNRNSDLKNANAELAHRNTDLLGQVEQRRNDQSKQELQDRIDVYEAQVCMSSKLLRVHAVVIHIVHVHVHVHVGIHSICLWGLGLLSLLRFGVEERKQQSIVCGKGSGVGEFQLKN